MIIVEKYEYDVLKTMELLNDLGKLKRSSLFNSDNEGYAEIYTKSNENLKDLFKYFSVKDKNVLSVLASSDHVFTAYYLGAKSVDTFDLNYLTEYYYYLRKWLIEYKGEFHPDIDRVMEDSSWIKELLVLVNYLGAKEEIAYKYWSLYTEQMVGKTGASIFKFSCGKYETVVDDVLKMRNLLRNKELHFIQENISETIDKSKKYDVIILSNILEYFSYDIGRLERVRDNLFDILEDDGQIIASHLMDCCTAPSEVEVFSSKFKHRDFLPENSNFFTGGYCYTKK